MSEGVFAVVAQSLGEFRAAADGEPGRDVATIGASEGAIPDAIRHTLRGVAEVLRWLQRAADEARQHVITGDALLALLEAGSDAITAFPAGVEAGAIDGIVDTAPALIADINSAIQAAGDGMDQFVDLAQSVLPSVEDLDAIRREIVLLLGERQGPQTPDAGALSILLLRIGASE
ncbi:hypothetical protein [Haliangium ochraceum]|uniref:Methyl-accepting chemotaxis sensory transducer n=1 Tax=Haliangium ochraceum (strain DSM 14365 / JCM 11303 / SMP-2) TaxID=502025 RepID=D0LVV8_HALO1|nr:hypothetical protein [Haliangium ochraceum]ACY14092.1 methyl-accepting chemotaxis sensory transducer [Haliangium ochraceum DSM 14365]